MAKIKVISGQGSQPDGVQIGVAGEKVGFFGATPVVVPVVANDATVATVVTQLKALGLFTT